MLLNNQDGPRDPWAPNVEQPMILLTPQDTELPAGFPFKKISVDLRQALILILDLKPGDTIVLGVPESIIETLIDLRSKLDYTALALVGTDQPMIGMWALTTAPLQEVAVAEIMASRKATPEFSKQGDAPRITKDDVKTFDRDISVLSKRSAGWDGNSKAAAVKPEDTDET